METGDLATWAASAIAFASAGVAVYFARRSDKSADRSADAADRSASADERALHLAKTPAFKAMVEDVNGNEKGENGWHRLVLQLIAPADLDGVNVELLTEDVQFTPGQTGVEPSGPQRTAVHAVNGDTASPMAVGGPPPGRGGAVQPGDRRDLPDRRPHGTR